MKDNKIKEIVKKRYSEKELERIPKEAVMGLGCGNPTALADLKDGEVVLDLGSSAFGLGRSRHQNWRTSKSLLAVNARKVGVRDIEGRFYRNGWLL